MAAAGFALIVLPACTQSKRVSTDPAARGKPTSDDARQRVTEAMASLQVEPHCNDGALVYRVGAMDGKRVEARTELHYTGRGRAGYTPGLIQTNTAAVVLRKDGQTAELRVTHPDYCEFSRPVVFKRGQVIVRDDITLEPTTRNTSVTITGMIRLEDGADPGGIEVRPWEGGTRTTTDSRGFFKLSGLRPGRILIIADKAGYHGLYAEHDIRRGETQTSIMQGLRQRAAKVEWVYQPDEGSRDLSGANIVSGRAILWPQTLDRVSFAKGFVQVRGQSDFLVYQRDSALLLYNFDITSGVGPAIVELGVLPFEDVREAPLGAAQQHARELKAGMVYAFRCYDG